jgi:hypothetical protein
MYFAQLLAAAHIAELRNTPGGRELSPELIMLLALVVFDEYLLFPSEQERQAFNFIEIAFKLGPGPPWNR